jgi:hypothetical protein
MNIEQMQAVGQYLLDQGFDRRGKQRMTTWAILSAHAAEPCTHDVAQQRARLLLATEAPDKPVIKGKHPRIQLGLQASRDYFLGPKQMLRTLAPFAPRCVTHKFDYNRCDPNCEYGVSEGGRWVHEALASVV